MKIYRCIKCGYIYRSDQAPGECPICHHSQSYFEEIKEEDVTPEELMNSYSLYVAWMNSHQYQERIDFTDDKEIKESVIRQLAENIKKLGQAYCPCRITTDDAKKDRKIICPCIYQMGEIEFQGKCHCGLFIKC